MSTVVSICNQALAMVGGKLITSIDDDITEAKVCKANYEPVRDELLEAANWSFTLEWLDLPKLANPPLSEFANAFQLPSDVIRVIFVGKDFEHPTQWQREGMNIMTNNATCMCQVVRREVDTTKFTPKFVGAFATRLAAEMALPLTNNGKVYELLMGSAERKLTDAINSDNSQGRAKKIFSSWLQSARAGGYTGQAGPYV